MKTHPDMNDTLRDEGVDAVRARHDKAQRFNGRPKTEQPPTSEKVLPQGLNFVDMRNWDNIPVPVRKWAVFNRIPFRQPTIFSGEGSVGKSIAELQLSCAHVLGRDWLGSMPTPGPAIYLGCEDEVDELHRRLADICKSYGVKFADLIKGGLHLLSHVEGDALLAVPDRSGGKMIPTPLYDLLLEAAGDIKPMHIGIDTLADTFGGNEIDRIQVRQFVSLLRKLARQANGSVVLLSHPSLTGINSGSGLSGSTQWHNSFRARMYMHADPSENADDDARVIEFLKNQYGKKDNTVTVRYQNGVFVPDAGKSQHERAADARKAEDLFTELLGIAAGQHRYFGEKKGPNYAPARLAEMPQANGMPNNVFKTAMEQLFAANKIKLAPDPTKRPSKASMVIVPT
jgi:RecA-family ATPase